MNALPQQQQKICGPGSCIVMSAETITLKFGTTPKPKVFPANHNLRQNAMATTERINVINGNTKIQVWSPPDTRHHCYKQTNLNIREYGTKLLTLPVCKAVAIDSLWPRVLSRGLQNSFPYTAVHGQQNTSLIVHWILLNCHSPAIKPVNVAVSKRVPPSECLP